MHYYLKIPVVRESHEFVKEIYRITERFPTSEQYGLTAQLRRAAVSIPTNICEGKGHGNDRELRRYLAIARGSLAEITYLTYLAYDLGLMTDEDYANLKESMNVIGRMSAGLHRYLSGQIYIRKSLKRTQRESNVATPND